MPVSRPRSKSVQKLRNILRNNVAKLDKFRVEKSFFPNRGMSSLPWWSKRAKKQSVIKRKSELVKK